MVIETVAGTKTFYVETADTKDKREQGLMFRAYLKPTAGMLFVFPKQGPVRFWMRNTFISLDLIFADASGEITKIIRNTIPQNSSLLYGPSNTKYVLEILGGESAKNLIKTNDKLFHPLISPSTKNSCR